MDELPVVDCLESVFFVVNNRIPKVLNVTKKTAW